MGSPAQVQYTLKRGNEETQRSVLTRRTVAHTRSVEPADRPTCVTNGPPPHPGCPPSDGHGTPIGVSGSQTLPHMPRGLGRNTAGPV